MGSKKSILHVSIFPGLEDRHHHAVPDHQRSAGRWPAAPNELGYRETSQATTERISEH